MPNIFPENEIPSITRNLTDALVDSIFERVKLDELMDASMITPNEYNSALFEIEQNMDTVENVWTMVCQR